MLNPEEVRENLDDVHAGSRAGGWELCKVLLAQGVYLLLHVTYSLTRTLWWMVTGTYGRSHTKDYAGSAHVQTIWMRYMMDHVAPGNSIDDFITTHASFEDPEYVLKDEVSLYVMTPTCAVFVEVPPEKADIWRGQYGAFVREAQFQHAIRLIILPHHSFLRLTDRLGDTKAKVMLVQNTNRTGSTLLCRVFEETGVCVSWSEPEGLSNILKLMKDKSIPDQTQGARLLTAAIRIFCKPVVRWGDRQPVGYCLKLCSSAMAGFDLVHQACPEFKLLFMYRHGQKVMRSFARITEMLPLPKLLVFLLSIHPIFTKVAIKAISSASEVFPKVNFKMNNHAGEAGIMFWADTIRDYIKFWNGRIPRDKFKAARYEDLVNDPRYSIEKIFEFVDIPSSYVDKGLKAFETDSQAASPISIAAIGKTRERPLAPENVRMMDYICCFFGVPNWRRDFVLPNTVTHRPVVHDKQLISESELLSIFNSAEFLSL